MTRRREYDLEPWTPAHVRYASKVAIGLAVELVTGEGHPMYDDNDQRREQINPYTTAAKFLGAIGTSRADVLEDLTSLLRIHGVEPIPTVQRVLEAQVVEEVA